MKKILLSAASLAILSGSALAADLPSRKEAVVAPVVAPLWQGFYVGLNAGYGFGTANNTGQFGWANPAIGTATEAAAFAGANSFKGQGVAQGGFIGGGQVGYNYQYGQSFLLGFEADIQGTGINGQGNTNGFAPWADNYGATNGYLTNGTVQAGINWMGTARGRVGYLITPTVLTYVTGGLAYGGTYVKTFPNTIETSTANGGSAYNEAIWTQNSQQNFNVGWTAGGGAEWMMAPNWSIKGEALYYDLGNTTVSNTAYNAYGYQAASNPMGGSSTRAYYQGVIARAGVNYHFNLGSMPVVAKF